MVKGEKLGIWKLLLQARQDAVDAYYQMEKTASFNNPLKYTDVQEQDFDAIFLPGGHDKSIKEYLESTILQQLIVDFFIAQKPVGAICHGVVLVARSINPATKKSVIHDYKTTSLLKLQELTAYYLTRLWLHDYFLTYPEITVEDEVKSILSDKNNFLKGPLPGLRDSLKSLKRGFFVRDRNYLSARWPGDAYRFSVEFINMIETM
jgi:putative intracellular protease/amidase